MVPFRVLFTKVLHHYGGLERDPDLEKLPMWENLGCFFTVALSLVLNFGRSLGVKNLGVQDFGCMFSALV